MTYTVADRLKERGVPFESSCDGGEVWSGAVALPLTWFALGQVSDSASAVRNEEEYKVDSKEGLVS